MLLVNGQTVTVTKNGGFQTQAALPTGTAYSVTVQTQPQGETCVVNNGTGVIGTSNVINVAVACTANPQTTYTVGGAVSGLSGTLLLTNNGSDMATLTSNGPFTFSQPLFDKAAYDVTVFDDPQGQTCTVSQGSGTVQGANVTSVQVSCADNPPPPPPPSVTYTVGGTVSGLSGTVALSLNGGSSLSVSASGSYTFPKALGAGAAYTVAVATQPAGQTCTVTNGTGTMGSTNVTNVNVTCAATTYSIGGTLSGLGTGLSVVLQDNGGDDLTLTGDGAYTFATQLAAGSAYAVTVKTQPTGQTCTVTNGTGTMGSANVTGIGVSCVSQPTGFAYVANYVSNSVSAYAIDGSTGALTPVAGSPFAAGKYPFSVTINPAGTLAYVANNGNNTVSAYAIGSNGALTPLTSTLGNPFATGLGPRSVTVDPAGTFAYVTNYVSNTVSAYAIDASTGALTPVAGSPFAAGNAPFSVTVNPAGTFAYVANNGDNTVSAYAIDASTGALTPVTSSPFATGTFPISVTVAQPRALP